MKAAAIIFGVLCLMLPGCMSASVDKNKSDTTSHLRSDKDYNVTKKAALDVEGYNKKKMKWILISTNQL